jgi:hypothetical protein
MTREEAIKRLKSDIYEYADFTENPNENEFWTAFDMAIKALEAPPNDNWEGYSKRLWKNAYEHGKADAERKTEKCGDCISRHVVLDLFAKKCDAVRPYHEVWQAVKKLPSVEPERKTGKWLKRTDETKKLYGWYQCSQCGAIIGGPVNYCSECGSYNGGTE